MRGAKRALKPNGKVVAFDVGFEARQNPIAYLMAKLDSGRVAPACEQGWYVRARGMSTQRDPRLGSLVSMFIDDS